MSNAAQLFGFKKGKREVERQVDQLTGADAVREQTQLMERQAEEERQRLAALQRELTAEEPAMPSPNDDATRRARRRSIAARTRGRGRQSTILTTGDSGGGLGA